jgi:hypothetical protein
MNTHRHRPVSKAAPRRQGECIDLQPWVEKILALYGCSQHLDHNGLVLRLRRRQCSQLARDFGPGALVGMTGWLGRCGLGERRGHLFVADPPRARTRPMR